jgi:hypothetical protein
VVVVRAEVLRRYPGTLVYAVPAKLVDGHRVLDDTATKKRPVFGGRMGTDVAFFGFDLLPDAARGSTTAPGWFLVFEEQPGEPKFGLDVPTEAPIQALTDWKDLTWAHLATPGSPALAYIDLSSALRSTDTSVLEPVDGPVWHLRVTGRDQAKPRGADHAHITLQRPVRVAIHASEMLL